MRVAILSLSAGSGHTKAAQALETAFNILGSDVKSIHYDGAYYNYLFAKKLFVDAYLFVANRYRNFWGYLYDYADKVARDRGFNYYVKKYFQVFVARRWMREVFKFSPDVYVSTHFYPAEVVSFYKKRGKISAPHYCVITDYDLNRIWVYDEIDYYIVGNDLVRERLKESGVEEDKILELGIPIRLDFSIDKDREELFEKLELKKGFFNVLVIGGSFGSDSIFKIAVELSKIGRPVQLIFIAGKKKELRNRILKYDFPEHIKVKAFGYVENIDEFLECSDVLIAKSGGLMTSEALAKGVPLISIRPLPGQEERNIDYLVERGAGFKAFSIGEIVYFIRRLIDYPYLLEKMKRNARMLGKKDSSMRIAKRIYSDYNRNSIK